MAEALGVGSRPWVCVEGIYYNQVVPPIRSGQSENKKIILYSGTLMARYGINNLMDAFAMIKDEQTFLWIFGDGDAKTDIKKRTNCDSRIKYFGQVSREEVLHFQRQATILINPRTSEGEFTKYSFPSKIIEYFASGTPTIMHKLPGIPEEYYDYCFVAEREDAVGLYNAIMEAFKMNQMQLDAIGRRAQNFIYENKNIKEQVGKIFEMLNELD